jgi:hypothetical protein
MLWAVVVLMIMLGTLLLVVVVCLFKYAQLSRFQRAIEGAWFNDGTCAGETEEMRCRLHAQDQLAVPPQATLPTTFSASLALRLADYVARVEMPDEELPVPPGHEEEARYTPNVGPTFGVAWSIGTTLVLAWRATVTHRELQDDLMAWQVDWDTGERVEQPMRTARRSLDDIAGTKGQVHSGFHAVYLRYLKEVLDTVQRVKPKLILLAGHSLGGAMSTLLTLGLLERREQLGFEGLASYVMGTPRVGNAAWDTRLRGALASSPGPAALWRVVNTADLIQTLPLDVTPNFKQPHMEPFYYVHAGPAHTFQVNRGSWRHNHNLPNYIEYLAGLI